MGTRSWTPADDPVAHRLYELRATSQSRTLPALNRWWSHLFRSSDPRTKEARVVARAFSDW